MGGSASRGTPTTRPPRRRCGSRLLATLLAPARRSPHGIRGGAAGRSPATHRIRRRRNTIMAHRLTKCATHASCVLQSDPTRPAAQRQSPHTRTRVTSTRAATVARCGLGDSSVASGGAIHVGIAANPDQTASGVDIQQALSKRHRRRHRPAKRRTPPMRRTTDKPQKLHHAPNLLIRRSQLRRRRPHRSGCAVRKPQDSVCLRELLCVWWSVRGCFRAYLSTRPLCRVSPLFSRFVRSFDLDLARAVEVNRRCLLCCVRPWCDAQATAARSALFVFGVCGCGVF